MLSVQHVVRFSLSLIDPTMISLLQDPTLPNEASIYQPDVIPHETTRFYGPQVAGDAYCQQTYSFVGRLTHLISFRLRFRY